MFEKLELRRLLSAAVSLEGSSLLVSGTPKDDHIEVTLAGVGEQCIIRGTIYTVYSEGEYVASGFFPEDSFAEVVVIGMDGDDAIGIANTDSSVPLLVFADGGNDYINAYNAGSAAGATIYAGAGNDHITLGNGRESESGYVAYGEEGNDQIFGSRMDDRLFGDFDPNDPRDVVGDSGVDVIYGGQGNDELYGGGEDDWLIAEEGDDYLDGGLGTDVMDGGEGADTAMSDIFDITTEIEKLLVIVS